MKARAAVLLGLAALLVAPAARADDDGANGKKAKKPGLWDFEVWKPPVVRERNAAKTLAPGELDLTPLGRFDDPPRAVRVRVYADRDYRGAVLHWREKIRSQLERINHVTEPVLDARLEVESLREWDATHTGATLEASLDALYALDPARDVDLVVGLVTPFRGVASSIHMVGMAGSPARSFVMRGLDDEEEGRALEREFTMLPAGERERLYADRKAHKEIVIFLHEWAHTLGAMHLEDPSMIMNPAYDPKQAAFSDFEKRLLGVALDARLGDRGKPYPESAKMLALLEKAPREEGSDRDRAALAAFLRARVTGGAAAAAPTASTAGAAKGPAAALAPSPAAVAARATLEQAMTKARAGDVAGAAPLVFDAAKQADGGPPDASTQVRLAVAAATVGALSLADAALARAPKEARPAKLVAELEATRSRVALPRDAAGLGVGLEDEPRYVAAFWAASAASTGDPREADHRLATLAKAFPDSAGRAVVACEVALTRRRWPEAERQCDAALAKDPAAIRAHLAAGHVALHARRNADAEKHFRRALDLDPSEEAAWRELAQFYRAAGASTRRDQLAREHEAILGTPLRD